jgi:hypothetical protein
MAWPCFLNLLQLIESHPIFYNSSWNQQRDPSVQLAVAICHLGSNGKLWIQNPGFFSISSGLHASSFPLELNITSLHIKQHMLWNYPWVQTEFQLNMQFTCDYLWTHFKPPEGKELCNGTRQQVPWNLPWCVYENDPEKRNWIIRDIGALLDSSCWNCYFLSPL